ncbi:MAG: bifunctional tRNA (5-methylaminomethyl-2-thiouridine)(34)-methyltransferase MnmD/FAD-dependent 5-carboxymethylaminomethyl-2-thiouridine(34) oxidoreductase MnmC [Sulfuritalea sp.]|nr:bifunctional tRNA (5-methylaminomethyl-2-thiouridine)(34)-methyltransferase MnmD/FAD-dependent 5-carboxymethylaminomethyl-2-thiouridine(34) oxidoreductase MnmC [Sulfuritalea sp.]
MYSPLVPAEPAAAGDGTPFSTLYDDVYHTAHGGLGQARHVFLAGNDLPQRWTATDNFVICETGFGLGLNFLATWQAWRESAPTGRLHFISVEKHPFRRDDLATLLEPYPELASLTNELLQQWPPLTPGFHRLHFEKDRLALTLLFGDAQVLLPQLAARIDAVYLDGFAPSKNPELWSPELLAAIARNCRAGATLATWSVTGELRRALEQLDWLVQRCPGFSGKREMLQGSRREAVLPAPTFSASSANNEHRAIVIGAGLAGTAISERLASLGWRIELFERHAAPAQEASGNPAGILLPHLAKDDALAARLSRACFLYALCRFAELEGIRWSPCGVLQVARDSQHEALQRATVQQLQLPADFLCFLERDTAATLVGWPVVHGGWWFPGGGWANPGSVCNALLAAAAGNIRTHFGTDVASLRSTGDGWQIFDAAGTALANAPHVILANACSANRLLQKNLPLTPIRGQISCLPKDQAKTINASLRHVICRAGYVTPPQAGVVSVGASFDRDDADLRMRPGDHDGNMQRLDELLPGAAQGVDLTRLGGRVGLRAAAPDRLPLIGTLPDTSANAGSAATLDNLPRMSGLHALLGLSARGLVWAPLAAELLACQLSGEPLPIERELVAAVDSARFHLRALRRGTEAL